MEGLRKEFVDELLETPCAMHSVYTLRNAALVGFEDINLLLDTEPPPATFYLDLKCFDFHKML